MHFQIIPTTMCNARCFYCYEIDTKSETMTKEIEKATVEFIRKIITNSALKKHNIDWFGGEPMLVPGIIERIAVPLQRFSESNGITLNSEIVTNASLIDDERIKFLKRIGVSRIHISLDGMKDEYGKRKSYVNGNNYFDSIISSIEILQQNGFRVMLRINVDRNNITSCEELIDYLTNNVSDDTEVHVAPLYGIGTQYLSCEDVYDSLRGLQDRINTAGFSKVIRKSVNSNKCRDAQQRNYVIKPNGNIIHCEHMYDCDVAVIGNVFDGINNDTWMCDECNYYEICKYGCSDEANMDCRNCWKSIWS